jgi:hypothetical protein
VQTAGHSLVIPWSLRVPHVLLSDRVSETGSSRRAEPGALSSPNVRRGSSAAQFVESRKPEWFPLAAAMAPRSAPTAREHWRRPTADTANLWIAGGPNHENPIKPGGLTDSRSEPNVPRNHLRLTRNQMKRIWSGRRGSNPRRLVWEVGFKPSPVAQSMDHIVSSIRGNPAIRLVPRVRLRNDGPRRTSLDLGAFQ